MLEAVRIRSVWSASCCDDATFIPLQGGFSNTVSAAEPLAAAAGYIGNMHTPWHPKVRSSPSPRSDSNLVRSLDQPEECALRIGFAARNPGPRLAPRERRAPEISEVSDGRSSPDSQGQAALQAESLLPIRFNTS